MYIQTLEKAILEFCGLKENLFVAIKHGKCMRKSIFHIHTNNIFLLDQAWIGHDIPWILASRQETIIFIEEIGLGLTRV